MNAAGAVGGCSLAVPGVELVLLGDYWRPGCDQRSDIGWMVHRAKDQDDLGAAAALAGRFAGLAETLAKTPDGSDRLVVPVPPTVPQAGSGDGRLPADDTEAMVTDAGFDGRPLVDGLARSLAAAGAGQYRRDLVVRTAVTPRLRHVDPQQRPELAARAGYRASQAAGGRHVLVVDDVILTGTTVAAVAACLYEAKAASVTAAVAARPRLS